MRTAALADILGEVFTMTIDEMPILLRREVEARFIKPFLDAFAKEIGEKRTYEIAGQVIDEIAFEAGRERAAQLGGKDQPRDVPELLAMHSMEDGCDNHTREVDDRHILEETMDCAYARMYDRLGMRDLGYLLSCRRDYKFFEGVNSRMRLKRTHTIMQGGKSCDFWIELKGDSDENESN